MEIFDNLSSRDDLVISLRSWLGQYDFFHKLIQNPKIEKIWIHGNRAKNIYKRLDHVELGIKCTEEYTSPMDWLKIELVCYGADTIFEVKLTRIDTLPFNDLIRHEIEHQGILIHEKTN